MGAMGPKWEPKWEPWGQNGSQKGSQEGAGKPTEAPDPKKSPKLKENRWKTPARPRGKIRGSDTPQEAFPGALPQNPAEKNMLRLL